LLEGFENKVSHSSVYTVVTVVADFRVFTDSEGKVRAIARETRTSPDSEASEGVVLHVMCSDERPS